MPVYRATIPGRRKPLLIRKPNATEAYAALVKLEALKADEMAEALEAGEKIWNPGDELPEDDPAPEAPKAAEGGGASDES